MKEEFDKKKKNINRILHKGLNLQNFLIKKKSRCSLSGANQAVTRLDYDKDKRVLLGSSNDNMCRLWNVDNQRLLVRFLQIFTSLSQRIFVFFSLY